MAQPTWDFLRIVNRVLRLARKETIDDIRDTNNPPVAQDVIETVQEEYQDICSRQDWIWTRETAFLETVAHNRDAKADVTNGSASVDNFVKVSDGTPYSFSATPVGLKFKTDTFEEFYTVTAESGGTVTLDRPYLGPTGTEALTTNPTITLYQDEYDLATNFKRFLETAKFINDGRIDIIGVQEFRRKQLSSRHVVILGGATAPRYVALVEPKKAAFLPYPVEARSIIYDFVKTPDELTSNTSVPSIPQDDMSVLLHKVMAIMFTYFEDDSRAQAAAAMYVEKYGEMTGEKTNADDVMQMVVQNNYRARYRAGRGTRRYGRDRGRAFDNTP